MIRQKKWFKLIVVFSEVVTIGESIKTQPIPFEDNRELYNLTEAKRVAVVWAESIAKRQGYQQRPYVEAFELSFTKLLRERGFKISYNKEKLLQSMRLVLREYEESYFWLRTVMEQNDFKVRTTNAVKVMMALLEQKSESYCEIINQQPEVKNQLKEVIAEDLNTFFTAYYDQKSVAVGQ